MQHTKHPYEWRLQWRQRLPWFLIDLGFAQKGTDCHLVNAEHLWYNIDGINSGCYYCKQTTQDIQWEKVDIDLFL